MCTYFTLPLQFLCTKFQRRRSRRWLSRRPTQSMRFLGLERTTQLTNWFRRLCCRCTNDAASDYDHERRRHYSWMSADDRQRPLRSAGHRRPLASSRRGARWPSLTDRGQCRRMWRSVHQTVVDCLAAPPTSLSSVKCRHRQLTAVRICQQPV